MAALTDFSALISSPAKPPLTLVGIDTGLSFMVTAHMFYRKNSILIFRDLSFELAEKMVAFN